MWGDGQWYPDASGAYFYYDDVGNKQYWQGDDYYQETAQDTFDYMPDREARGSMMPDRQQRPSISVSSHRASMKITSS